MADSIMSITIRDARRPCAPYQSSTHSFKVYIYHCDGKPLFWKGVNFRTGVWLTERGQMRGLIHGQFKVPPGCYLIRALAPCHNVVTEWAYVGVGCNETVCVNLLPSSVRNCMQRLVAALELGTAPMKGEEETPLADAMPRETKEAADLLKRIAEKLPEVSNFPEPPTAAEIKEATVEPKTKK
jgi:hypothetical protein